MGQASLKTRIPPGFVSRLKSALVPDSIQPRVIPFGLFAGLTMDISFHSRAQPYLGLWEREIAGWTRRLSKGARTALDIGCRDCFYTMFFAKRTEATVLAFDPDPAVATEIARCTALNAVNPGRIRFFQKAVGSEISLDSLLPLDEPIVVKMDTDGGEVGALETASRLLQADCRWVIETHSSVLERGCIEILEAHGLQTRVIDHAWWRAAIPERRARDCRWLVASRHAE